MIGFPKRFHNRPGRDLVIDGGRDRTDDPRDGPFYEDAVGAVLRSIIEPPAQTGRLVLDRILEFAADHAGRGVRIHTTRRRIHDAVTFGLDRAASPSTSMHGDHFVCRGHGAQSRIAYFPFEWPLHGAGRPGETRDEILLHELVHAHNMQRGVTDLREMTLDMRRPFRAGEFDDADDFVAVMVTNIYQSERGRPLRRDHRFGSTSLTASSRSVGEDPGYAAFFRQFDLMAPDFVAELAAIDAPFNPWRARGPGRIRETPRARRPQA